ncbi:hypothetical protein Ocin01_06355, partial [Orchesella cincta]
NILLLIITTFDDHSKKSGFIKWAEDKRKEREMKCFNKFTGNNIPNSNPCLLRNKFPTLIGK